MAESDSGSGNWLMTYADFITLLMIFFIVLYTLTPGVERNKFEAVIGAFQGEHGVLQHKSVVSDKTMQISVKRDQNWHKLKQMIKDNNLSEQVQIKFLPEGVHITLGEAITFDTYSAILIPPAKKILAEIARAIDDYEYEKLASVDVFGNTDNRPVISQRGKYADNWELGAARAISVVKFLIDDTAIPPAKYEASTFGKYHPKVSNKTTTGQRKNRRVEIFVKYVQQQSKQKRSNNHQPGVDVTKKLSANNE